MKKYIDAVPFLASPQGPVHGQLQQYKNPSDQKLSIIPTRISKIAPNSAVSESEIFGLLVFVNCASFNKNFSTIA